MVQSKHPKCPHCHGTGNTLTWMKEYPVFIECGYCGGTGIAQGD
jgi:DnaJ-class molecular chaperone